MKNEQLRRMLEDSIRDTEQAITLTQAVVKAAGDLRHSVNKAHLVLKAVAEDLGRNEGPAGAPDKQILDLLERTQASARQAAALAQQHREIPAPMPHYEHHHHHDHDHDHHHDHSGLPTADELISRASEEELNNRRTVLHLFEGPDNVFTRILSSATMRGGVGRVNFGEGFPTFREDINTLTERQFMNPAWTTGFYQNSKTGSSQFLLRTEEFVLFCEDLNEDPEKVKLGIFMIQGMPEDVANELVNKPIQARWICYKSMDFVLAKVCKMFDIPYLKRALIPQNLTAGDAPTPLTPSAEPGPTPV